MTEKEAWLMIREAFQRYAETGIDGYLAHTGICRAINILSRRQMLITEQVDSAMRQKMIEPPTSKPYEFWWWPLTTGGARERVKFIDGILKML